MIKLAAVGDIMFGRGVVEAMETRGVAYPLDNVATFFRQADIVFANLESPLTERGVPLRGKDPQVTFRAHPSFVFSLHQAGVNLVSIANNHITDYGETGLLDTIQALDRVGIMHVGAGKNLAEALRPAIIEKNGFKVAFLAFNAYLFSCVSASSVSYGVAPFDPILLPQAVRQARASADLVVLSLHWGIDYLPYPIPCQVKIIKDLLADGNVHCVLGHHPHVIQGVELGDRRALVYSLGDFLFDEPFEATKESFIFRCILDQTGVQEYEIIPTRLMADYRCEVLQGAEKDRLLQRIVSLSDVYHTLDRRIVNELNRRWVILNLKWLLKVRNFRQFKRLIGFLQVVWAIWATMLHKIAPQHERLENV